MAACRRVLCTTAVFFTSVVIKITTADQTQCDYSKYRDGDTCVDKCPKERRFIKDRNCVTDCGDGWGASSPDNTYCMTCPKFKLDGYCSSVCPEGTRYTWRSPTVCEPLWRSGLILASLGCVLLGMLLCCAVFYRIRCACVTDCARWCRNKIPKRSSSPDYASLLEDDSRPPRTNNVV